MTSKLISEVITDVLQNQEFRNDFLNLTKSELSSRRFELSYEQVKRLLEAAAIFSLSSNEEDQQLALKTSIFLLNQYKTKYPSLPFVVELILTRLGDLPTIMHMINRQDGKDFFSYFNGTDGSDFPYLQFPEIARKRIFNQVSINNQKWNFTDFQAKIFFALDEGKNLAFSAPTSAGKSYVVHNYIVHRLLTSTPYCAIYIVPTKSLMTEVQETLIHKISEFGISSREVMIFNSASENNIEQINKINKKVLVLTQERLQQLLSRGIHLDVNLLVVDEAQKVSDDSRGIIIEDAVQELLSTDKKIQKVFISPNIADPNKFKQIFNIDDELESVKTRKTPVGQNIFLVNFSNREVTIALKSIELNEVVNLENIPIERKISDSAISTRKIWVANNLLKGNGHTLIYCNRPVECRNVAEGISPKSETIPQSPDLMEGIEFIKTHVHEYYYLIDHLRNGVGYHYGRMPQFVRFTVKELFDNKKIDFLCCTSTLLEGVNLPAKNIVLYKPKSGLRQKMERSSVLNLAGRAGRLAKDYYGNIYCIDAEEWESGNDAFDGELEEVESALEKTFQKDSEALIDHLQNYKSQSDKTKNIETIATSLIVKQLKYPNSDFLSILKQRCKDVLDDELNEIKNSLLAISDEISGLDKKVILRNRSIDPRLQFELYEHLKKPNELILPMVPSDSSIFYNNLEKIFSLISKYLLRQQNNSYRYYAFIANGWIQEKTYKALLENKIRYTAKQLKGPITKKFVNKMIDELDETLENTIKFDYSRGLQCYCDIVEQILRERNDHSIFCKELPEYLEAGASDPRIFLLLGIGLSRNSAISLYKYIDRNVKDIPKLIDWIKNNQILVKGVLHEIQFRELESIIKMI